MEPLVAAAITPHGEMAIPEACGPATGSLGAATRDAMARAGRALLDAQPDAVVVLTPHNVHVTGHMAVVTASAAEGVLDEAEIPLRQRVRCDMKLADTLLEQLADASVPAVGVSYGGNSRDEALAPLDWGAIVPLWHLGGAEPLLPAVVMSPARDLDTETHLRAGAAIVRAAAETGRRIALVASADQGHGHQAESRYGLHRESAEFDARVVEIVRAGDLSPLTRMGVDEVRAAIADSWWQMVMLHGALRESGRAWRSELLAYEVPTYFGMLTALFTRDGD